MLLAVHAACAAPACEEAALCQGSAATATQKAAAVEVQRPLVAAYTEDFPGAFLLAASAEDLATAATAAHEPKHWHMLHVADTYTQAWLQEASHLQVF